MRRSLTATLTVLAIVGLAVMVGPTYQLRNMHSKKCLDVGYGSMAIFAAVDQYECFDDDKAELWYLDNSQGTDHITFQNVNSLQCLDDFYGGTADFTQADQYPCVAGDPAEMWTLR